MQCSMDGCQNEVIVTDHSEILRNEGDKEGNYKE